MKNANITNVKWGEIYLCDLGSNKGSVQSGKRPVLVLQNNIGNNNGPTTVVATISKFPRRDALADVPQLIPSMRKIGAAISRTIMPIT